MNVFAWCVCVGGGGGGGSENFNDPPCKPSHDLTDHLTITIPNHVTPGHNMKGGMMISVS